jgi:hypothetical protein
MEKFIEEMKKRKIKEIDVTLKCEKEKIIGANQFFTAGYSVFISACDSSPRLMQYIIFLDLAANLTTEEEMLLERYKSENFADNLIQKLQTELPEVKIISNIPDDPERKEKIKKLSKYILENHSQNIPLAAN